MISVVIPTYNAAQYLPELIAKLQRQTVDFELVVIDSESNDDTRQILEKYKIPFHSVPKREFNHGATRNIGVKLAKNEIIVFLTQDALPASDTTIETLVTYLCKDNNVAMAYGRQLPYPHTDLFGKIARYTNYPAQSLMKNKSMIGRLGIKTCSCSNSFAAYRKSLLLENGGFPNDTILGEDVSIAARLILKDYILGYCAESEVYHSHDYSVSEEFRRYFDIGVFHRQQHAVLQHFTKAESEGIRYIIEESKYLIKMGAVNLLPLQFVRTLSKYIGYKIGWFYRLFPTRIVKSLSMHRSFWK